jgi:hypothetical protein
MRSRLFATRTTVSVGLFSTGVISGFLVGWFIGDGSLHDWVLIYAGAAEFFGVLLIAAPELAPLLLRAQVVVADGWRAAMIRRRDVVAAIRRRFRQPQPEPAYIDARSGTSSVSGGGSLSLSTGPGQTLEEKVDFLLRREQGLQEHLKTVVGEVGQLPEKWGAEIREAESDLRAEFNREIREVEERHIRARLLGLVLVVIGILLNTWGNLI